MAIIFTVINNKGGTGKTTTVANLGAALGINGYKVLLVDLDSQCNLGSYFGVNGEEIHVGKMMLKQSSPQESIKNTDNISIIPSTGRLLDYETRINNEPGREYLLSESLEEIEEEFDFIFIDCPPSLGSLSINALVSSSYYIVPMQAENFAYIGLDKILDTTTKVKKRMNPNLDLAGILLIKHSQRTKFSEAVIANIQNNEKLGGKLFKTRIRQDIALMESSAFSQTIFEYMPGGRGAHDFRNLASEIIKYYGQE